MKNFLLASLLAVAALALGCGGVKPADVDFGGVVNLDGAPAANATLVFVPADAKGETIELVAGPGGGFMAPPSRKFRATRYNVGVIGPGVPEKFADPAASGVVVDVKKSDDGVEINLTN